MQHSNNEKNHFYIGNIFSDESQILLLKNIQKKLKKKYGLKNYHWNNNLFSNMIYLGYFTTEVAQIYMDEIISHLLKSISERFSQLDCSYTGFKLDYDKSYYKISLKFTDTNNYLESIIIPYLHQNAILPIYPKRKDIKKPSIDLIYFKKSYVLGKKKDLKEMKDSIKIQYPIDTFKINHISLIKGTTTRSRTGTPSTHDQMSLFEINRYTFPLKNTNNISTNVPENISRKTNHSNNIFTNVLENGINTNNTNVPEKNVSRNNNNTNIFRNVPENVTTKTNNTSIFRNVPENVTTKTNNTNIFSNFTLNENLTKKTNNIKNMSKNIYIKNNKKNNTLINLD